ncbi:hypothetical protein D1BOALGB6SA_8634 [Olavius sp. associated proteobacterium Delta 1]|nr:hypothetical protein D1BOALGB6SA_8634 [Olavius sp. associated proteobacterium Delta 1]
MRLSSISILGGNFTVKKIILFAIFHGGKVVDFAKRIL